MAYEQFATIYDVLMKHAPYEKWSQFTTEIIDLNDIPVQTIVDLGCGTGELTIQLTELDYDVIGIDQSSDMLTIASNKALDKNLNIKWIQQDIRELTGLDEIDLFISYCDVLNYITSKEDLQRVFERVYQSLKVGGLFIFDFHSLPYANEFLMDQTFADVTESLSYIWECERGEKDGEMLHYLTFFQKVNDYYIRFDEVHHQQTYAKNVYKELLESSQFTNITFYRDFLIENSFSEKNSERIFAVAKK